MGKIDIVTRKFMRNPVNFADAFNKFLYHGEQVIDPTKLKEMDTAEIVVPYGKDAGIDTKQKYRDVLKISMADEKKVYRLLGIENQSDIHYAMPVRNGLYDFMELSSQVNKAENSYKKFSREEEKNDNSEKVSSGEFLSGFHKDDKLIPVMTLVIYWGADKWDAPVTLREMYNETDEHILGYVADYKINLLTPEKITDEELAEFHTELRQIMTYIKYSEDKETLKQVIDSDEAFSHLDKDATDVLNVVTGSKLKYDEDEEKVDMCKAIREMLEDSREEGIEKGIEIKLIDVVIKKTKKNKSLEEMADELEEDVDTIRPIYDAVLANQEKNAEEIYSVMKKLH